MLVWYQGSIRASSAILQQTQKYPPSFPNDSLQNVRDTGWLIFLYPQIGVLITNSEHQHVKCILMSCCCGSGGKQVPCPGKLSMNPVRPKENKGEKLGKGFLFLMAQSFSLSQCAPCPPACALHPVSLDNAPKPHPSGCGACPTYLCGTGPSCLVGAWPITYQEWRWRENGCYSPPLNPDRQSCDRLVALQ